MKIHPNHSYRPNSLKFYRKYHYWKDVSSPMHEKAGHDHHESNHDGPSRHQQPHPCQQVHVEMMMIDLNHSYHPNYLKFYRKYHYWKDVSSLMHEKASHDHHESNHDGPSRHQQPHPHQQVHVEMMKIDLNHSYHPNYLKFYRKYRYWKDVSSLMHEKAGHDHHESNHDGTSRHQQPHPGQQVHVEVIMHHHSNQMKID
jgi:hypothetical protein